MRGDGRTQAGAGVEWWIRAVPALAVLQAGLYLFLQVRPGSAAVVAWHVGPPLLRLLAAALLIPPLVESVRRRQLWNRWRVAGLLGLAAIVWVSLPLFRTYPSSHDAAPSLVRFRLPLEGPVRVAWGGPARDVNYHVVSPPERWAYDLLVTREGRSYRGEGTRLEDYYAWDRPVLAPADGIVRSAHDGEEDVGIRERHTGRALGNHIAIEVAPSQFLFVGHLRRGSVAVQPGDRVAAGQPIGRIGNSGRTREPHVHLHVQDAPGGLAEGIPLYFHGYLHDGIFVERGMPEGGRRRGRWIGQIVEQVNSARRD